MFITLQERRVVSMKKKEEKGLEVKKYPERKGRTVRLTQNLFQTGYIKL